MKHELTTFTLRHLLERSASRHAHKVAVTLIGDPSSTLTYAQLKEKVDAVASYLLSIGVSQGDKIALIGENNTSWVVAYFAIITSGAIAVPILPDFSQKEVNHILEHSGATSLILSSKLYDKCASFVKEEKNTIIRLEDLFHIPPTVAESITKTKEFSEAPGRDTTRFVINSKRLGEIRHDEDALVSIIYTSGTTGSSKGVMLSNRNLASNASASVRQFFKVKPGMRFLSILPLSHSYEFTVGLLRDEIHRVVTGHVHFLQEECGVGFAFGKDRDQHIGTRHLTAARALHMDRRALHTALEGGGGHGFGAVDIGDEAGELFFDEDLKFMP